MASNPLVDSLNIAKETPVEKSIADALRAAKLGNSEYTMPNATFIASMEKNFIPGIKDEYEKYFDAVIEAAKAQYGPTSPNVADYVARKAIWKNWSNRPENLSLQTVDLSKSGGKTAQDLINKANEVKQFLTDQTSKIKNETATHVAASKDLNALTTALYGAKGTADVPAKGSLVERYNTYKAQLDNPKTKVSALKKLYGDTSRTESNPAAGSLAYKYQEALAKQKPVADNAMAMTPLEDIIHLSLSDYTSKTLPSYTNFLAGVPEPKPGETPIDANTAKVGQYLDEYKKTGQIPTLTGADTALIGQLQKEVDTYEQDKLKTSEAAKAALAAQSAASIDKTRSDITSYNKLLDNARKKAPVVAPPTSTLLDQLQTKKTDITAPPAPPKFTPPPKLGLNLSNDFNTRMIQQDLAAQQQLQNPGTYAAGQFDPFFSGFLNSASQFSTQPSKMNPDGSFSGGALYRPNTGVGFGFQNAYDASAPTGAAAVTTPPTTPVTGVAAGGYMDAQSIGQNNQALQSNQQGIASIPNMSQYTNYTNNPGMASPTQNTDDGGIGGISVLGQTNPVW